MSRVYVSHLSDDLGSDLSNALRWLEWESVVPPDSRVFVKPNLTWVEPTLGVTTRPEFIREVVSILRTRTEHVIVGESDGGYHAFPAEDTFRSHGLYDLDATVVNLSKGKSREVHIDVAGRSVVVELPVLLLDEIDVFVTLPVPKVHAMTRVTLGLKNQWGCIPNTMRLRNHYQFPEKIVAINKILAPALTLFDGKYFLDRNGPMKGLPVEMDLLIASDDVGAGSLACCEIMQIAPRTIRHFSVGKRAGVVPRTMAEVETNQPIEPFKTHRFTLKRTLINLIALAAFRNSLLTRLLYDSIFAGPIHKVLYAIRRNRLVAKLLYGSLGPPDD